MSHSRHARRGFTLVEIATVVGLGAIIVAGSVFFIGEASTQRRSQDTLVELGDIRETVHDLYAGKASYSGLTTAYIATDAGLPEKWVATNTLVSPFLGSVSVSPVAVAGISPAAYNEFTATFSGIPREACVILATSNLGAAAVSVTVGGTTSTGAPMTPAAAETACASAQSNTVTWTLY